MDLDLSLNSNSQNQKQHQPKLKENSSLLLADIDDIDIDQEKKGQIMMLDEEDNQDDIAIKDRNRHRFDEYNFTLSQNQITFIDNAKDRDSQKKYDSQLKVQEDESNNQNKFESIIQIKNGDYDQLSQGFGFGSNISLKSQPQKQVAENGLSDIVVHKNDQYSGDLASELKIFQNSQIFKVQFKEHAYKVNQQLQHNSANTKQMRKQQKLDNLFDECQNIISQIQNPFNENSLMSQQNVQQSFKDQQKTMTLLDQFTIASRISEDQPSGSSILKSLNNFLSSCETIYKPYCQQLQQFFENVNSFSTKSLQNMLMHLSFFTQKNKQQSIYLKRLDNVKAKKVYQNLQQNQVNNLVYIDSKIVLRQMHQNMQLEIKQTKIFNEALSTIWKSLKSQIQPIVEKRYAKQKKIADTIKTIQNLEQQLKNVIQFRNLLSSGGKHLNQFDFKVENPYLKKDHYLQIKYIMEKQTQYLKKIKSLSKHIIIFTNSVFIADELAASVKIRQALMDYQQVYLDYNYQLHRIKSKKYKLNSVESQKLYDAKYQHFQKKVDALEQTNIDAILKVQMTKIAYKTIPNSILEHLGFQATKNKQKIGIQIILEKLNNYFQNQVFMSAVQMENQYVFYKKQGFWSQKQGKQLPKEKQRINFVLTTNKYMHLQIGEKLATMKISDVKISKKGNLLILTDKGKGLVGYLVSNGTQLGRIQFQTSEEVDVFANKIKQLLQM